MTNRYYSAGTVEALFMLSRGHCYEPDCQKRVMRFVQDSWRITVQIAHIEGLNPGSARFNRHLPEADRNKFANLVLLCKEHHDIVDNKANESRFGVDLLRAWKANVEGVYADDLDELDWLSGEKLQGLMATAIEETRATLFVAIEKVRGVSSETLAVLKKLVTDSFARPYLDADSIASLKYSAGVLEKLPSHAELLYASSRQLGNLPDSTELLFMSARRLQDLEGMAGQLSSAASRLQEFQDHLPWLEKVTDRLPSSSQIMQLNESSSRLGDYELQRVVDVVDAARSSVDALARSTGEIGRLEAAASSLEAATVAASDSVLGPQWSWRSFKWGFAIALLLLLTMLILFTTGVLHASITVRPA